MSATVPDVALEVPASVDARTREIVARRRQAALQRRGTVVRRALLVADMVGLALAFLLAELVFGTRGPLDRVSPAVEYLIFLATLPAWVVVAKLYRLYDHDDERADHSTVDDLVGVFHVVTTGTFAVFFAAWLSGAVDPNEEKLFLFWLSSIVLVTLGRAIARARCRRTIAYLQNTIVVGAGNVGQLVARKLVQHAEYGINLVGFVDDDPRERREELAHVADLGPVERLPELVRLLDIERVVIAFSRGSDERTAEVVRQLRSLDVQVEIVPRLFDIVGPHAKVLSVESMPLVAVPTTKRFPFSRTIKRAVDVVGASIGLVLAAPLLAFAAWRIRRESPGPVFFRQTRLGEGMREFTLIKFRTMRTDVDQSVHREYIRRTMSAEAAPTENGLYKLDRSDAVTRFGHFLRKTSLDELPQLLNVLRGEMSLVGPRPCLAYETENFAPHHFERFDVPAGITGLWQVTARAHATFGEALDMDVTYARSWSLGLDLWLLCRTPLHVLRRKGTV